MVLGDCKIYRLLAKKAAWVKDQSYIRWFETLNVRDIPLVGGKNASLGEMIGCLKEKGVLVPEGFAITSQAYWDFLEYNHLNAEIGRLLKDFRKNVLSLSKAGSAIRRKIVSSHLPPALLQAIHGAYSELCQRYHVKKVDVAVRSSATAEDLPTASFAGQQETYLNIIGEKALIEACLKCYASLFTDRAIAYRVAKGFDHMKVALSIGVQKMVRSDCAGAGVMFTLDTETGFRDVVVINASLGLGESVVQGNVNPDEYLVFKPLLGKNYTPIIQKTLGKKGVKMIYAPSGASPVKNVKTSLKEQRQFVLEDSEILQLAQWGKLIETHYQRPMDIEWAKDGKTGELFIVQARPETVQSQKKIGAFKTYHLKEKGKILCKGLAIGEAIVSGKAQVIKNIREIAQFQAGNILVTEMTSPDWVPIMQQASAIITDHGGRTSHAAIVSRELGLSAIVGTNNATRILKSAQEITLSCAEGELGFVYSGRIPFEEKSIQLDQVPRIKTKIMLNIGSPVGAFRWWQLPCHGIGLARMEFIINSIIKIHPMALIHLEKVTDGKVRKKIEQLTSGYANRSEYFVDNLAKGIARIAASQYPHPVIVRMSDFKTNEYANLIGGSYFEPKEENPMLGFRGASRYYSPRYREGFDLECQAIKRVREKIGLTNVVIMIPFCRTIEEADQVLSVLADNGLKRGQNGLEVYVMAEIPSNIILAEEFAERFDGFSIGSNDLTQLTLGIDRDSEELAPLFNERNPAVKKLICDLIKTAKKKGRKVGICGQAPSDYPDFAAFLVDAGIDSISLNPDSVVGVTIHLANFK